MNAHLATLVAGLVAQAAIRHASRRADPRSAPSAEDIALSDSDLRELGEYLGRPLTQQELYSILYDMQGNSYDYTAEELTRVYTDTLEAAQAREAVEQAEALTRRAEQAEDEREQALERARAAEREAESLRADVAWLKRALCERSGNLRGAIHELESSLFGEAETIRAQLSKGIGRGRAYRTQREADRADGRAQDLTATANRLAALISPRVRAA